MAFYTYVRHCENSNLRLDELRERVSLHDTTSKADQYSLDGSSFVAVYRYATAATRSRGVELPVTRDKQATDRQSRTDVMLAYVNFIYHCQRQNCVYKNKLIVVLFVVRSAISQLVYQMTVRQYCFTG